MTEQEARTRICCGPLHDDGVFTKCQASACMAWRDEYELVNEEEILREPARTVGRFRKSGGYCGLAGKPE